jgi:hypothetical protein
MRVHSFRGVKFWGALFSAARLAARDPEWAWLGQTSAQFEKLLSTTYLVITSDI